MRDKMKKKIDLQERVKVIKEITSNESFYLEIYKIEYIYTEDHVNDDNLEKITYGRNKYYKNDERMDFSSSIGLDIVRKDGKIRGSYDWTTPRIGIVKLCVDSMDPLLLDYIANQMSSGAKDLLNDFRNLKL